MLEPSDPQGTVKRWAAKRHFIHLNNDSAKRKKPSGPQAFLLHSFLKIDFTLWESIFTQSAKSLKESRTIERRVIVCIEFLKEVVKLIGSVKTV